MGRLIRPYVETQHERRAKALRHDPWLVQQREDEQLYQLAQRAYVLSADDLVRHRAVVTMALVARRVLREPGWRPGRDSWISRYLSARTIAGMVRRARQDARRRATEPPMDAAWWLGEDDGGAS